MCLHVAIKNKITNTSRFTASYSLCAQHNCLHLIFSAMFVTSQQHQPTLKPILLFIRQPTLWSFWRQVHLVLILIYSCRRNNQITELTTSSMDSLLANAIILFLHYKQLLILTLVKLHSHHQTLTHNLRSKHHNPMVFGLILLGSLSSSIKVISSLKMLHSRALQQLPWLMTQWSSSKQQPAPIHILSLITFTMMSLS